MKEEALLKYPSLSFVSRLYILFCFVFANFAIISTPTLNPLNTPKETLNDKFLGIAVAEQTHTTTHRK